MGYYYSADIVKSFSLIPGLLLILASGAASLQCSKVINKFNNKFGHFTQESLPSLVNNVLGKNQYKSSVLITSFLLTHLIAILNNYITYFLWSVFRDVNNHHQQNFFFDFLWSLVILLIQFVFSFFFTQGIMSKFAFLGLLAPIGFIVYLLACFINLRDKLFFTEVQMFSLKNLFSF